ncbi:MAG: hypothetical protein WCO63_04680 [Bacteroidota bacterium]
MNRPAPPAPLALFPPLYSLDSLPTLVASDCSGPDSLMSSEFQLASGSGNFAAPILDTIRDYTDIYRDQEAPISCQQIIIQELT